MRDQHDVTCVHSQLPFEDCLSALREALKQSELELVSELVVHHEVQRKLGLPVSKYTVFTLWDPLLTYEALTAEAASPCFTPFNIAVCEDEAGSTVLAPRPSSLGFGAGRVGTTLIARTAEERLTRILASVASAKVPVHEVEGTLGVSTRVHHRLQNALRFVTGDTR